MGTLYEDLGDYVEAEKVLNRALHLRIAEHGTEHQGVATVHDNLGSLYWNEGRYTDAEFHLLLAFKIRDKLLPDDHPDFATNLNNMAELHRAQGRFFEAEPLYKRALTIDENNLGEAHPDVAIILNNLALLYGAQGRFGEAELLQLRALAIDQDAFGEEHPAVALDLNNLGALYRDWGRLDEAEPLYNRALKIHRTIYGDRHPTVALDLNNLGTLYFDRSNYSLAEQRYLDELSIREEALGPINPDVSMTLNNLGALYGRQRRYDEAERVLQRARAIDESTFGPDHPSIVPTLKNLAVIYQDDGKREAALTEIRHATAVLQKRLARSTQERSAGARAERSFNRDVFSAHVDILAALLGAEQEWRAALLPEGFFAAQLARASTAADALGQTAARSAAGSGELGRMAREQQDLLARWRSLDAALVAAASRTPAERDREAEARQRVELAEVERRLDGIDGRLSSEFPAYAELTASAPLAMNHAQALLRPSEALVNFLVDDERTFAWVLRAETAELRVLRMRRQELAETIKLLRAGLNPATCGRGAERLPDGRSVVAGFDLNLAHALYDRIWGPLEPLLEGVSHVLLVPDGPLEGLPPQVLVLDAPARELDDRDDLRSVAWLARKYAISMLPSVGSLRALRELTPAGQAESGFIGVGDPLLRGQSGEGRPPEVQVATLDLRGVVADVAALRDLAPLPESAGELRALSTALGAGEDSLYLGPRATETQVRRLDLTGGLARAGVLAFATHGLVAGELIGVSEPGLVLTPPEVPSAEDDGLLAASEVAELTLNADWVILSACNTAAGDGRPGAEGLSGLARAFFYAGARALLVSHWSVCSEAAVALTTGSVERLRHDPGLGRAEALRRTMVELIETGPDPHPAYWAPFVVVGG